MWAMLDATLLVILLSPALYFFVLRPLMLHISERRQAEEALERLSHRDEMILDSAGEGIFGLDPEGRVIFINRATTRMLGYEADELMGGAHHDKVHHSRPDGTPYPTDECPIYAAYKDGRVHRGSEDVFWRKDGTFIPIDFISTPIIEGGELKGAVVIFNDITERKTAEEALKKSEEEKRIILDAMSERMSYLDKEMRILWSNRAFAEDLGLTVEEVKGRYCYEVLHKRSDQCPYCPEYCPVHVKVLETGRSHEAEIASPDGKAWFVRGHPVRDSKGNIAGVTEISTDITERKMAEREVQSLKQQIEYILGATKTGLDIIDLEFNIRYIDPEWQKIYGDPAGRKCYEYYMGRSEMCPGCGIPKALETKTITVTEAVLVKEGNRPVQITTIPFQNDKGEWLVAEVNVDITERKRLEEQLIQAQKMEAIGQLAGGIAHDFNNILTAIIGFGTLLKTEMSKDDPLSPNVTQILRASERAASLTQALLAFSRKQVINPRPVNLNEIIAALEKILTRIIGEDIELSTVLADEDLTVMADSTQIEQVLMNLATNARDAMPDGGSLTIRTELAQFDNEYIKTHGYDKPGSYALISIEDRGVGMDVKTRDRIFEPFYTTKEVGKGTGLGLAMAYGMIKQHDGYINVYSEPGKGTTFKIYLPLIRSKVEEEKIADLYIMKRGTETILVAEDDTQVRDLTKHILEGFGYQIMEAGDGEEAMSVFNENKDMIQLIILDVVMPKKNGKEVYDEIKKIRPDIKAIFTSGYNAEIIHKKGILKKGLGFISKPFLPQELLKKVREVLDK